jgi:hypothetical protein
LVDCIELNFGFGSDWIRLDWNVVARVYIRFLVTDQSTGLGFAPKVNTDAGKNEMKEI